MKINKSSIGYDISKELSDMQGNAFQLENITNPVGRVQVKPKLLTAILGGMVTPDYLQTDTFKFDETFRGSALPNGKSYSDYGDSQQKEKPKQHRFGVPSFGIRYNVRPEDYSGRRKAGTQDLLTEGDVAGIQQAKMMDSWDNFDELGFAQLLTTDTNIVRGGPFESYNFYTEIVGGSRTVETVDLTSTTVDFEQYFRNLRRKLTQELQRSEDSASAIYVICGDTFFDRRYEIQKNEGLARPIKFGLDLASQPIREGDFGSQTFNYAYFESQDGLVYINYGAEIIAGSKLIADDMAYMVPAGASNVVREAYAPAQTREYVNTEALSMYTWSNVSDRQGVTVWSESNKLFALVNPRAIIHIQDTDS